MAGRSPYHDRPRRSLPEDGRSPWPRSHWIQPRRRRAPQLPTLSASSRTIGPSSPATLPDARLGLRRRGRSPGDAGPCLEEPRSVRGARRPPLVAVPDRHERLPGHARRPPAARTPDGHGPGVGRRATLGPAAPRGALGRADPRLPWWSRPAAIRPRSRSRASRFAWRSSPPSSTCHRSSAPS